MTSKTKILIGVALVILGAVVIYFMMNKKGTTTTTTTTSSGLHGLDLGGIIGALAGTGTKLAETPSNDNSSGDQGARHAIDLTNSLG